MPLTMWKYEVPMKDSFTLDMPSDATVLTVDVQPGQGVMVWALVDPSHPQQSKSFLVAGTGHPIDYDTKDLWFIGSFQLDGGSLVFHLFEVKPGPF